MQIKLIILRRPLNHSPLSFPNPKIAKTPQKPRSHLYRVHVQVVLSLALQQGGTERGQRLPLVVAEGVLEGRRAVHVPRRRPASLLINRLPALSRRDRFIFNELKWPANRRRRTRGLAAAPLDRAGPEGRRRRPGYAGTWGRAWEGRGG